MNGIMFIFEKKVIIRGDRMVMFRFLCVALFLFAQIVLELLLSFFNIKHESHQSLGICTDTLDKCVWKESKKNSI